MALILRKTMNMKQTIFHFISLPLLLLGYVAHAQQIYFQPSPASQTGAINHIAVGFDGTMYGISDSGISMSLDHGASWQVLPTRPPLMKGERLTAVTATTDNLLIVGTENRTVHIGTIYASTNRGETWHYISGVAGEQTIRSIITTPNGDIYLSTYSNDSSYMIFRLEHRATNWQPIYRWSAEFPSDVNTLAADVNQNLYMMSVYGVVVSRDQGASWYKLAEQADYPYQSSDVSSTDSLVASGINNFGSNRLKSAGFARAESINSFTTQRVSSLAVNSIGHIFAGTEFGGVYRTTNGGASWQQVSSGLTNTVIHSLYMTPGDTLYAGSFGSIARTTYPTVDIKQLAGFEAKATFLEAIYPNPAKGRVAVRYKLDKPSRVSIAVFDGRGEKIMQLINETKVSGTYEFYPDIAGLPPGRYQIKLMTEDGFDMKPLVILR